MSVDRINLIHCNNVGFAWRSKVMKPFNPKAEEGSHDAGDESREGVRRWFVEGGSCTNSYETAMEYFPRIQTR